MTNGKFIAIEHNLQIVQQRIENAAARAGREPREITLVAISKTFSAEIVLTAHALGVRHFGENRVEEAIEKIPRVNQQLATTQSPNHPTLAPHAHLPWRAVPGRPGVSGRSAGVTQSPIITWHMVGHLQHRRVKDAAELFDVIHSVDSVALAKRIENRASALGKTVPILLEVNMSGEATKYGFAPEPRESLFNAVREILTLPHLNVQGLMTIAPMVARADDVRPRAAFRALRELRDELRADFPDRTWHHLSMGMTDDFEAAIAEGATIVRIGRAIFGERIQ